MGKLNDDMITRRKIEIFKKYSGDIDHFARVGTHQDKIDISDNEWSLIDNLLQDLEIVDKGLVADAFLKRLDERIKECCESEGVLQELKRISKK
jgi:hypothetical protein